MNIGKGLIFVRLQNQMQSFADALEKRCPYKFYNILRNAPV